MLKRYLLSSAIIFTLTLGLTGCSTFDGSQTVRNAQAYYNRGNETYTTKRVGSYIIVEQKSAGKTRKIVTNAVPMSKEEFSRIVNKTKLPGYYQPSRSGMDNAITTTWQKTFGFIADPRAQGLAEGVRTIKPQK